MPKKYQIEFFQGLAFDRGGVCLSTEYKSLNCRLKWCCKNGHIWEAIPNSVIRGTWCKVCSGKARKNISDMEVLASSRGGQCLSIKYVNTKSKLTWKCSNGHTWLAKPDNIRQGKWCPDCATGLSERICRTYFEKIFNVTFPNTKGLEWLRNENNNYLELDGYNKELKLAFEHQGEQHYNGISYYQKAKYDKIKSKLCKTNGVLLISIPQLGILLSHDDFHNFLKEKLKRTIFSSYIFPPLKEVDLKRAYSNRIDISMQELAKHKSGKFLSTHYLGSLIKHKWECAKGHIWETPPAAVRSGNWCPSCGVEHSAVKRKADFDEILSLIIARGGKCLTRNYSNSRTKLKLECKFGHAWETLQGNLKKGHWCPFCAGQGRLSLKIMKKLAKARKGKCLSTEYVNANSPMEWQCLNGHIWEAPAGRIKSGTWCLKCSGYQKLSLDVFHELAASKGGECLSRKYINANSTLEWKCSFGHKWTARANHIKRGSWCPICSIENTRKKRNLGIDEMNSLALTFNGRCLSEKYINVKTKLSWMCSNGHIFERPPSDLKRNRWCPNCT